jgi:hypothetical protein
MARNDKEIRDTKEQRKPYQPPAIEVEDDFAEETLLQFAPSGPFPSSSTCGGSGCPA